jgi:enamine deaminase RidA (YjgF/YER057c/UK114 family)
MIYTAGITARDAAGTVPAGIAAQTENILDRLRSILAEAGGTLDDVVKVSIYVVSLDGLATMNEVYRRFFPRRAPARAMVQVAGLADPDYLIEIEMVAVEPGGD